MKTRTAATLRSMLSDLVFLLTEIPKVLAYMSVELGVLVFRNLLSPFYFVRRHLAKFSSKVPGRKKNWLLTNLDGPLPDGIKLPPELQQIHALREELEERTGKEAKNLLDDFLVGNYGMSKEEIGAFYRQGQLLHIDFKYALLLVVFAIYRGRQLSAEDHLV